MTSRVFSVLGYTGIEDVAQYTLSGVHTIIEEIRNIRAIRTKFGEHHIEAVLGPDQASLAHLLGMTNVGAPGSCPYCDAWSLAKKGKIRTSFPGALIHISAPLTAIVFCFLHAWIRIACHRYDALHAASKTRKGRSFSEAALIRLLSENDLPIWSKTASNPYFLWLKLADAQKIIAAEEILAKWEGISPHVWRDMYEIYQELEQGITTENEVTFDIRARAALKQFTDHYPYVNSVHVYEHMIIHHGLELQKLHGPLGRYSNQLAEKEHHGHNVSYLHHTFRKGWHATKEGTVQSEVTRELLITSYLVKHHKPVEGIFHQVILTPRGHGRKTTSEKKQPLKRQVWTPPKKRKCK